MKKFRSRKRLTALFLCMLLLISFVPTFAAEKSEASQALEGQTIPADTTYEIPGADEGIESSEVTEDLQEKEDELPESEEPQIPEQEPESEEPQISEQESEPEEPQISEQEPESEEPQIPEQEPEPEEPQISEQEPESEEPQIPEQKPESEESQMPETEQQEEVLEDAGLPVSPLRIALNTGSASVVPEHHKYIRDNGDGTYTLTLNVKGMYDSTINNPKLDVLLIVDISKSMDRSFGSSGISRIKTVKDIVTGSNGLSDAILGNDQIIGRMAVVSYSGSKGSNNNPDVSWNDARTVQEWTSSKKTVDAAVSGLVTNGGTNCQAGLYEGARTLANSDRDAQKVVIFLSDGQPTYYYDTNGKTQGTGNSDENGYCADAAYRQAASISGLWGFYTVGITTDVSMDFLTTLANSSSAKNKAAYSAATSSDLAAIFEQITADITEYTCRDITITDTLSDYVQLPFSGLEGKVIKTDGNQAETDITDIVHLNSDGKTITADFPDTYVLDRDSTYAFSFLVEPTQKAFDEYADAQYVNPNGNGYPHTGSANSDAPGNETSSNQPGFYSNASASLKYIFGTEGAAFETVDYVEKPVVQVSDQEIQVTKCWEGVPSDIQKPDVTVNLYQDNKTDVYRTITLKGEKSENTWTGKFMHIAKGHEYHIKEVQHPGYKPPSITGNDKDGFVITNIYDLTEVTVTKVWEDSGNEDGKRPETIQVQLKNGTASVGDSVTIGINQKDTAISEDGNRWSYTWKALPKSDENGAIHYTVEEITQLSDYETAYSQDTLTVTNTRKPSLTIRKVVDGDMGDKTREFGFTVTLKNKNGQPLAGSYAYTRTNADETEIQEGTLTVNREGAVEFSLKHRDSITIKNLPTGTSYQITENSEDAAGYEVSYDTAKNGKLSNKNVQVTVTNTQNTIPVTGLKDIKNGWIPAILSFISLTVGIIFRLVRRKRFSV